MIVRFSILEEQEQIEALSQTHKSIKEFKYLWRLYKNWKPNSMPIVATTHAGLIGFHAVSFGKKYINSYYLLVIPEAQEYGVAGEMVAFSLREAQLRGIPRLKFRVRIGGDGQTFWEGFGLKPFAQKKNDYLYDVDISKINSPAELNSSLCRNVPLERYKGITIL